MLDEVLDVSLKCEPRSGLPVEAQADELAVTASAADSIFQLRERCIQTNAELFVREESATDVDRPAQLPKAICQPAEAGEIHRSGALGDQVDDSGRARNAEHQRIGSLERFDLLLVLRRYGEDAGRG